MSDKVEPSDNKELSAEDGIVPLWIGTFILSMVVLGVLLVSVLGLEIKPLLHIAFSLTLTLLIGKKYFWGYEAGAGRVRIIGAVIEKFRANFEKSVEQNPKKFKALLLALIVFAVILSANTIKRTLTDPKSTIYNALAVHKVDNNYMMIGEDEGIRDTVFVVLKPFELLEGETPHFKYLQISTADTHFEKRKDVRDYVTSEYRNIIKGEHSDFKIIELERGASFAEMLHVKIFQDMNPYGGLVGLLAPFMGMFILMMFLLIKGLSIKVLPISLVSIFFSSAPSVFIGLNSIEPYINLIIR